MYILTSKLIKKELKILPNIIHFHIFRKCNLIQLHELQAFSWECKSSKHVLPLSQCNLTLHFPHIFVVFVWQILHLPEETVNLIWLIPLNLTYLGILPCTVEVCGAEELSFLSSFNNDKWYFSSKFQMRHFCWSKSFIQFPSSDYINN